MILAEPAVAFDGGVRRADHERALIKRIVREVADSDQFILGSRVAAFERSLGERLGGTHVIAVASGTAAVRVGLAALGLAPGQEVIVGAFGFHSSVTAVSQLGARPVLADVTEHDWTLDPDHVKALASERTAGVIPVHLFSLMADMPALDEYARERQWWVLENSAVAVGMRWGERPAGRWGTLGLFSFHPVKPLAGSSDGAALVTDDPALAERCRMLRNHGSRRRFVHELVGFNARMDEITAAVLSARLPQLDADLRRRAEIAGAYQAAFQQLEGALRLPPTAPTAHERTFYAYVVASPRRDALERHLAERGIDTKIYYPQPLHLQPAFAWLGYTPGSFPNAERASRESLALPLHAELTDREVETVIAATLEFHGA